MAKTPEEALELLEAYCWSEPDEANCVPVNLDHLNSVVAVLRTALDGEEAVA